MTCARAFEIDLPEFLVRPTAPHFASFRDHYPRCAVCAPEVRAWTELHQALAAGQVVHPAPDALVGFADRVLAPAERAAVERHLAACAPCRDEVGALARFTQAEAGLEHLAAAAPVEAALPRRRPATWTWRLPRLVFHPAFAYSLVLLLLFYPALTARFADVAPRRELDRPSEAERSERMLSKAPAEPAARHDLADEVQHAAPVQPSAPAPPPGAAGGLRMADEAPARELRRLKAQAKANAPALVLSLGSSTRPVLAGNTAAASGDVSLRLPVRADLRAAEPLEVRVLDDAGARELRERVATGDADHVEVQVPVAWLSPGRYRVELRALAGQPAPDVFAFDVGGTALGAASSGAGAEADR